MSDQRTTVYLVRHCDVENPKHLLYGFLPNFGLSKKGKVQAETLGKFLADKPMAQIYASPLQRAQETAKAIADAHTGLAIETTDELIEARFSKHIQGIKVRSVAFRRPLWFIHKAFPGLMPNDESNPAMAARVCAPIMRILRDHPGVGGVCVSHGDPIQAFWNISLGKNRFLKDDCVKGGLLRLTFVGSRLEDITYMSPETIAATVSARSGVA